MLGFIQGPSVESDQSRSELRVTPLPDGILVFDHGNRLVNKVTKSTTMQTRLTSINLGDTLNDLWETLKLTPHEIAFLKKSGRYTSGRYLIELIGNKTIAQQALNGHLVLFTSLASDHDGMPIGMVVKDQERLKGNIMQRPAEGLKSLIPNHFLINEGPAKVHGHFFWFDKIRDHIILVVGKVEGDTEWASQIAAQISALLQLVVIEMGNTDGEEILNRLSYYYYKFSKDKYAGNTISKVSLSLAILNKKQKVIELLGANHGIYYANSKELCWVKGSRATIGDPKILLSRQEFRGQKVSYDDCNAIYLTTEACFNLINPTTQRPLGRNRFSGIIESVNGLPFAQQGQIMLDHFTTWSGGEPQKHHQLILGFSPE